MSRGQELAARFLNTARQDLVTESKKRVALTMVGTMRQLTNTFLTDLESEEWSEDKQAVAAVSRGIKRKIEELVLIFGFQGRMINCDLTTVYSYGRKFLR